MSKPIIRGMVFEGGGPSGVAHVGAVQVFKDKGFLDNVHHFVGSSAGAIMAGALACNATPEQLHNILFNTDFNQFKDHSRCVLSDIRGFIKNYGWYHSDRLHEWYGEVLSELHVNPDITFNDVYEQYGNYLQITVTNVNSGETIYLDHTTDPDMKIRLAVKRSCLMPLIFRTDQEIKSVQIDQSTTKKIKHYYTDGGLLNNYPIGRLDHLLNSDEVVGFKLMSTKELSEMNNPHIKDQSEPPKNVIDYIMMLYTVIRNQALKIHIEEEDWNRTVKIDVGTISGSDFDLSDNDKFFLINQGKAAAEKYLKNN